MPGAFHGAADGSPTGRADSRWAACAACTATGAGGWAATGATGFQGSWRVPAGYLWYQACSWFRDLAAPGSVPAGRDASHKDTMARRAASLTALGVPMGFGVPVGRVVNGGSAAVQ